MESERKQIPALKQPKPKKRTGRRIICLLIALFISLLIYLFFQSSISKIAEIHITGFELVSEPAIGQAAGILPGDSYFYTSSAIIEKRVGALKTIKSVKVTKKFPGYIQIDVMEYQRVAFQLTAEGDMEVLLADGSAVSLKGKQLPMDRPIMSNWKADDPWKDKLCAILAQIPEAFLSDISEIKPNPSVAYEDKIKMYTRSDFEIDTTVGFLKDKIPYISALIMDLKEKQPNGVLSLLDSAYGKLFDKDQAKIDAEATPLP